MKHESLGNERMARRWHVMGVLVNLCSLGLALGGLAWHWWAAREHQGRIRLLEDVED